MERLVKSFVVFVIVALSFTYGVQRGYEIGFTKGAQMDDPIPQSIVDAGLELMEGGGPGIVTD